MQTKNIFFQGKVYVGCDEHQVDYLLMIAIAGSPGLSDITHYPYIGEEKLQDGQEVFEFIDYKLRKQVRGKTSGDWYESFSEARYDRIVAIGIPQSTENIPSDQPEDINQCAFPNCECEPKNCIKEKMEEKETQDRLWDEILNDLIPGDTPHEATLDDLKRDFTITRK